VHRCHVHGSPVLTVHGTPSQPSWYQAGLLILSTKRQGIGAYIHREDPDAAERWIRRTFARVKQREKFPSSGKRNREAGRDDIRELSWKNYRIIYRIDRDAVSILTVRHAKQILPIEEIR
jgi:plasmid stabilization system protein ParE